MKSNKIYIVALLLLVAQLFGSQAQAQKNKLDRSKAPKPGKAPKIEIGKAQTFTLPNGLKVFVVESHKTPRVSYSLTMDLGPISEKDKAGTSSLVAQLMRAGTTSRSKEQIDNEIDFIGASIYPSATGIGGSALKKHNTKLLDLMTDILYHPTFPKEELDKVKKRKLSNIKNQKSDAGAIQGNLTRVLNYGKNHPYGELETEESIQKITTADLKKYYDTYFKANEAYLVVVGDITLKEAKPIVEKYFGQFKKGDTPKATMPKVSKPNKTHVALVEKPGAVQTNLAITYPIEYNITSKDYLTANLMNQILGSAGARLYRNLREDKAFTYGAYSSLRTDKYIGSFNASAKVRNEVTDSATVEFFNELRRIRTEKVGADELRRAKAVMAGSFARAMESPRTIANMTLSIARYNLPEDFYTTYLQKLEAITAEDIQAAAQKYIHPDQAHIIAVGDVAFLKDKMKKFGKVTVYDMYGNVDNGAGKALLKGVTIDKVMDNYYKAMGGKQKLKSVKTLTTTMTVKVQGMTIEFINHQKNNKKSASIQKMPNGSMRVVYNGKQAFQISPQGTNEIKGKGRQDLINNLTIFPLLYYKKDGKKYELTNVKTIDGQQAYEVTITRPNRMKKELNYFSVKTGHLISKVTEQEVIYKDFKKNAQGFVLPTKLGLNLGGNVLEGTVKAQINQPIPDKTFEK